MADQGIQQEQSSTRGGRISHYSIWPPHLLCHILKGLLEKISSLWWNELTSRNTSLTTGLRLIGYFETNKIFNISLLSHLKLDATDIPAFLLIVSSADSWHLPPTSLLSVSPQPIHPYSLLPPVMVSGRKGIAKRKIKKILLYWEAVILL